MLVSIASVLVFRHDIVVMEISDETVTVLVTGDTVGEDVPLVPRLHVDDELPDDDSVLSPWELVTTRVIVVTEVDAVATEVFSSDEVELAVIGSSELSNDTTEEDAELVMVSFFVTVAVVSLVEVPSALVVKVTVSVSMEVAAVDDDE